MTDRYDLNRFVEAQANDFETVLTELRMGRKDTHWMWYIFPQIAGLGTSSTSQHFAISSLAEAKAYLKHPVLGLRLVQCTKLVLRVRHNSITRIFDDPDDLKFHASMTLFAKAASDKTIFESAIERFFGGKCHSQTLKELRSL